MSIICIEPAAEESRLSVKHGGPCNLHLIKKYVDTKQNKTLKSNLNNYETNKNALFSTIFQFTLGFLSVMYHTTFAKCA